MDVFSLYASISLDPSDFESGIASAKKKFESFSKGISDLTSNLEKSYSGIKDILSPAVKGFELTESVGKKAGETILSVFKGFGVAATAAAGGAVAVEKSAFDAYANYEQLVGGMETLFKDSASQAMDYAQNAYKTAGMSANEYMDLTTSFAASLLQSLGGDTAAAVEMADLAAQDMADNWNKMGSEARSVQDAYRGFAKQNYTMLDNLKLGYGGTKAEMERLLADAEKFSGIKYDLSSYADIVSAIHVIQQEMGITGTTALEASTTIQGSVSSMKGAWQNFLVGMADSGQNTRQLMDNLVDSVVTAGNNIVPRIKEIAEQAVRVVPELLRGFSEVIPEFARMGGEIVQTLADGLSVQVPALMEFGSKAVGWIAYGISQNASNIASGIESLLSGVGEIIGRNSEKLLKAGESIIEGIFNVFHTAGDIISRYIGDFVPLISNAFLSYHETIFTIGMDILGAIGQGIVENKEEIQSIASSTIGRMVEALSYNAPMIIEGGLALLEALVGAILDNAMLVGETAADIVSHLATGIGESTPNLIPSAVEAILKFVEGLTNPESLNNLIGGALSLIEGLGEGIIKAIPLLIAYGPEIVVNLVSGIMSALPQMLEIGGQLIMGLLEGIGLAIVAIPEAVARVVTAIVDGFKALFGIHSPSTVMAEMGVNLIDGLLRGISDTWDTIVEFFSGAAEDLISFLGETWGSIKDAASEAWGAIKEVVSGAWDGIQAAWEAATEFFGGIWDGIKTAGGVAAESVQSAFGKTWDAIKSSWDGAFSFFGGLWEDIKGAFGDAWDAFSSIGKNIVDGIKSGISNTWKSLTDFVGGLFDGLVKSVKSVLGIASPSKVFAGIGGNMALGLQDGWEDEYADIRREIENGLSFSAGNIGVTATGTYNTAETAQGAPQAGFGGGGNTYVTINSPVSVDAVQAAREWKKTTQRMAMSYV